MRVSVACVQSRSAAPSAKGKTACHEAPRLRNVSYNGYTGFLKQLFSIAVKDRIIAESPAASLRVPWKKPQTPKRLVPTVEQFEAIVESIRSQQYADTAQESGDFVEFLGLAGVEQAEASSLTWGDIDWQRNRLYFRRHKTDTHFYVPIYAHLRPLLVRLKEQARGRASDSARVFKIKDAKKALSAACARLNLPHFSQRNLRQSLIRRLIRAKVDVKSISKWQGHQDGGQLILDTYTEVFGDDDDTYEQAQLAKIGGGTSPVEQPSGPQAEGPTSRAMKGPTKHDAHPADHSAPAADPAPGAVNPYQKGDKVKTACKGTEVEAEVVAIYKDEVQVRTPDGELRWRTVRTVQPVIVPLTPPDPADAGKAEPATPKKKKRVTRKRR